MNLKFLLSCLLIVLVSACGSTEETTPPDEDEPTPPGGIDVTFTITNRSSTDWIVTDAGGSTVAEENSPDVTWLLELDKRYRIINNAGAAHPLELLGEGDERLLAQTGDGTLEADPAIAYEEDDEGITFTMTGDLVERIRAYLCTFHPQMRGEIVVLSQ